MSSATLQFQKQVGQLQAEAALNRMKLSDSLKEMMDHIQKYEAADPFVAGIAQNDNPFKDQKGCLIL
ncbi:hypothetical protein EB796_021831 [Bugula neritina]|uniref:Guanine nucleotide-binding protein subunit gamma n=1 Tax=Bugula neritina TaxID=10212 RepID=A0A7J7J110_BUGNE|nr:hypothetical protein EB796_021831 [Bugula neritina]